MVASFRRRGVQTMDNKDVASASYCFNKSRSPTFDAKSALQTCHDPNDCARNRWGVSDVRRAAFVRE